MKSHRNLAEPEASDNEDREDDDEDEDDEMEKQSSKETVVSDDDDNETEPDGSEYEQGTKRMKSLESWSDDD